MSEHHGHEIESGVVADWNDHRDLNYAPTSRARRSAQVELENYRRSADETWHQRGEECTGFALAAIANFLIRRKHNNPDLPSVSRRMLYEMAQKYDGEMHVEGSTLRGALKGWSRVGVSSDQAWPYHPDDEHGAVHGGLTLARVLDGRTRPLLGYQRVANERVETMQRALAAGNPLYVAARTHEGWYRLFLSGAPAVIERTDDDAARGIHAFVIIGYNEHGFTIHNSWGPEWGDDGYALLPYDQWRWGATDVWVVDAGIDAAPATKPEAALTSDAAAPDAAAKQIYREMWPHLVVLRDDGQLASSGLYEMDAGSIKTMLYLFDQHATSHAWADRAVAVIADGGALATATTIDQLRTMRDEMLAAHIYPLFIVWETAWQREIEHELRTWINHRSRDGLAVEVAIPVAAAESGCRAAWDEVQTRSHRATHAPTGGAYLLAQSIAYKRGQRAFDLHLVSHGAGDQLMTCLAGLLASPITSAVAVAPTTTLATVRSTYGEMLACGCLRHLTVLTANGQQGDTGSTDLLDTSLLQLAGQVWSLDGSTMRRAGRDARASHTWMAERVPIAGVTTTLPLEISDRLTVVAIDDSHPGALLFEPTFAQQLVAMLTASATRASGSSATTPSNSLDPIVRARAEITSTTATVAVHRPQPPALTRDPLTRALAGMSRD